jgi:hypothetical protein
VKYFWQQCTLYWYLYGCQYLIHKSLVTGRFSGNLFLVVHSTFFVFGSYRLQTPLPIFAFQYHSLQHITNSCTDNQFHSLQHVTNCCIDNQYHSLQHITNSCIDNQYHSLQHITNSCIDNQYHSLQHITNCCIDKIKIIHKCKSHLINSYLKY